MIDGVIYESKKEAADALGLTPQQFSKALKKGKIVCVLV